MASAVRSSLLRQTAAFAAPASRSMAPLTQASPSLLSSGAPRQPLRTAFKPSLVPITSFHTTIRRNLLPPGPQVVHGTVNDPAPVPSPSPSHGHYHWIFERVVAAALVPLTIAPFAGGSMNPTLDALLVGSLLVHAHVSMQTIIIDYVPTWGWPKLRKFCIWALNGATVLAGIGLYEFETTDVGIVEATKRLWKA